MTNVQSVWCPNWVYMGPHHWTEYYPGVAYVDWVGMDLYQQTPSFDPNDLMRVYDNYYIRKPIVTDE